MMMGIRPITTAPFSGIKHTPDLIPEIFLKKAVIFLHVRRLIREGG